MRSGPFKLAPTKTPFFVIALCTISMTSSIAGWFCLLLAATTSAQAGDFPEFKAGQYETAGIT